MHSFTLRTLRSMKLTASVLTIVVAALAAQNPVGQQTRKRFATAEQAVQAVIKAAKANNRAELLAIFGADAEDLFSSGDKVADMRARQLILVALNEKWSLTSGANSKILVIGNEEWPYPIPLVKDKGGWSFDTAAGREEILYRRIGRNELSTIKACRVYVTAQKEYAAKGHDGKPAGLFAQKFASEPGKQDGLFWKSVPGKDLSPLGEFAAQASSEGYSRADSGPTPLHGYLFRLLTAQGSAAPGGAKSYIANGEMNGGYALVAYPAEYRNSGVMSFIINQDGIVYEKDLGEKTAPVANQIKEYNPDSSWHKVR